MREPLNQFAARITRNGEVHEFILGLVREHGVAVEVVEEITRQLRADGESRHALLARAERAVSKSEERRLDWKRLGFCVVLFLALTLTACSTCPHPPTEPVASRSPSSFMVVNNSGAILNIIQDGHVIAEKIESGQVVPIRPIWLRTSCVVAVGYTPAGEYVGTDSYIFQSNIRETWTVTRLTRPQTSISWH